MANVTWAAMVAMSVVAGGFGADDAARIGRDFETWQASWAPGSKITAADAAEWLAAALAATEGGV